MPWSRRSLAPRAGKPPVRMAFVYVPNGIDMRDWNPDYEGKLGELPRILKPLEPFKDDMLLLGNLTHNTGRALLDGAGDHGRCCGSYLTGVQVKKSTTDIKAGVSWTRLVANEVGEPDALPLARTRARRRAPGGRLRLRLLLRLHQQPGVAERDAAAAADARSARAVRAAVRRRRGAQPRRRGRARRSTAAASSISSPKTPGSCEAGLGPTDKRKLDEYLSSIREIERQIEKAENDNAQIDPHMDKPYGVPADFAEHFKLMTDMMTIAFQADLTRVLTFLVTREGTSRAYREIGISRRPPSADAPPQPGRADGEGGADQHLSREAVRRLGGEAEVHQGRRLLAARQLDDRLRRGPLRRQPPPARGSADPDRGQRGGTIKTGRRVVYRRETPMCNLFLTMMDRMGVHMEHFGDATGKLEGIELT